jgi:hypothetical protein
VYAKITNQRIVEGDKLNFFFDEATGLGSGRRMKAVNQENGN